MQFSTDVSVASTAVPCLGPANNHYENPKDEKIRGFLKPGFEDIFTEKKIVFKL